MKPPKQPVKGRMRRPKTVRTHVMLNGGQADHRGTPICEFCGHLSSHRIHDLTQQLEEEAAAIDARRTGER